MFGVGTIPAFESGSSSGKMLRLGDTTAFPSAEGFLMANGVFLNAAGKIYQAASAASGSDSTLSAPSPELLTAAPVGSGSADFEATVKGNAVTLRKANHQNG